MMRQYVMLLLVVLMSARVLAAPAPATTRPEPGSGPVALLDRAKELVADLQLNAEQKAKVDKIFTDAREELGHMRTKLESMPVRERFGEVREFFEGVRADLAFVLTPEQRAKVQKQFDDLREAGPAMLPPLEETATRIREAIPKLGLNQDQLGQVKSLFEDVRSRSEALRQQIDGGDEEAKLKRRELQQETRDKLAEILSPEQLEKMRELIRHPASRPAAPPQRGRQARRGEKTGEKSEAMSDTMMSAGAGESMMEGASREKSAASEGSSAASEKLPPGPAVGAAAPDFTLQKTDGAQVSLASLKGRVIVLIFGSYSAPTFRNRAASLEKLRSEFGTRATFFIVYSREAHPTGEWEVSRNKEDGISVEQARTLDARKSAATTAREKLKLTTPIVLDTLGNDTAIAYGAGPNSAYVINRDGTIAARQQWFEPLALRRALDAATKTEGAKPATKPAN